MRLLTAHIYSIIRAEILINPRGNASHWWSLFLTNQVNQYVGNIRRYYDSLVWLDEQGKI